MKGEKIRLVVSGFIGEREKRRIIEKNYLSNGRESGRQVKDPEIFFFFFFLINLSLI